MTCRSGHRISLPDRGHKSVLRQLNHFVMINHSPGRFYLARTPRIARQRRCRFVDAAHSNLALLDGVACMSRIHQYRGETTTSMPSGPLRHSCWQYILSPPSQQLSSVNLVEGGPDHTSWYARLLVLGSPAQGQCRYFSWCDILPWQPSNRFELLFTADTACTICNFAWHDPDVRGQDLENASCYCVGVDLLANLQGQMEKCTVKYEKLIDKIVERVCCLLVTLICKGKVRDIVPGLMWSGKSS